jgi:hypothetical protein
MKLPTISIATKARIKLFLLSLTATTTRKVVASGIVTALAAVGITVANPAALETVLAFIGTVAAAFYAG